MHGQCLHSPACLEGGQHGALSTRRLTATAAQECFRAAENEDEEGGIPETGQDTQERGRQAQRDM